MFLYASQLILNADQETGSMEEKKYMKYTIGDNVRFKLDSGEVQEGNIQYVEKSRYEEIFYINSFNRWAYKVSGRRVISNII